MNTSEFRIGNYINLIKKNKETEQIQASAIDSCMVWYGDRQEADDKDIVGIPLTEEWLLKFGFQDNCGIYILDYNRQSFMISEAQDDDMLLLYRDDIGMSYNVLIFIDFVHQLQNLYFALTNQELILNTK